MYIICTWYTPLSNSACCDSVMYQLRQFRKEASEISWHKWNAAVAVAVAIAVVVAALVTQASKCLSLYMYRIQFNSDGERLLAVPRPHSDICCCCCCCLLHLQNLCVRIFSRHAKGKLILFTLQLRLIFLHFSASWERKEKPRAGSSWGWKSVFSFDTFCILNCVDNCRQSVCCVNTATATTTMERRGKGQWLVDAGHVSCDCDCDCDYDCDCDCADAASRL